MIGQERYHFDKPFWETEIKCFLLSFPFFQKSYEQKQYKNGLKFAKQILSNGKFAEHGGMV